MSVKNKHAFYLYKALDLLPKADTAACRFHDILGFLSSKTLTSLNETKLSYNQQSAVIRAGTLLQHRYCIQHNSNCAVPQPDFDLSGPNGEDHSLQGLGLGSNGPTVKLFLTYAKYLKHKQVKLVLIENVCTGEFYKLVSTASTYIYIFFLIYTYCMINICMYQFFCIIQKNNVYIYIYSRLQVYTSGV